MTSTPTMANKEVFLGGEAPVVFSMMNDFGSKYVPSSPLCITKLTVASDTEPLQNALIVTDIDSKQEFSFPVIGDDLTLAGGAGKVS